MTRRAPQNVHFARQYQTAPYARHASRRAFEDELVEDDNGIEKITAADLRNSQARERMYYPQNELAFSSRICHSGWQESDLEAQLQILKARMMLCPGYANYRNNISDDGPANKAPRWPDDWHDAFLKACILYPPRGKQQHAHVDENRVVKKSGRNQCIAQYIMDTINISVWTFMDKTPKDFEGYDKHGKKKRPEPRKTISSTLQVHRKWYRGVVNELTGEVGYYDEYVLRYLGRGDPSETKKGKKTRHDDDDDGVSDNIAEDHDKGARMTRSTYSRMTVNDPAFEIFNLGGKNMIPKTLPSQPRLSSRSSFPTAMQPTHFKIYITDQEGKSTGLPDHVVSQCNHYRSLSTRRIENIGSCKISHPGLYDAFMRGLLGNDCQVYDAQASLHIDTRVVVDRHLIVDSVFKGPFQLLAGKVVCSTQWYKDAQPVESAIERQTEVRSNRDGTCEVSLTIGSSTLVKLYTSSAAMLQASKGSVMDPDVAVRHKLERISAVQTVTVLKPDAVNAETVLINHWTFTGGFKGLSKNSSNLGVTRFTSLEIVKPNFGPTMRSCFEDLTTSGSHMPSEPGAIEMYNSTPSTGALDPLKSVAGLDLDTSCGSSWLMPTSNSAGPLYDEIMSAQILNPDLSFDDFLSQHQNNADHGQASTSQVIGPTRGSPEKEEHGESIGAALGLQHGTESIPRSFRPGKQGYQQSVMDQMAAITREGMTGDTLDWSTAASAPRILGSQNTPESWENTNFSLPDNLMKLAEFSQWPSEGLPNQPATSHGNNHGPQHGDSAYGSFYSMRSGGSNEQAHSQGSTDELPGLSRDWIAVDQGAGSNCFTPLTGSMPGSSKMHAGEFGEPTSVGHELGAEWDLMNDLGPDFGAAFQSLTPAK